MSGAVETKGLGKRYLRSWGLRDCTFSVPEGKVAALVGPNGAGKSTLMRIAAGFARPTEGQIQVFGRSPMAGDPQSLAQVGYLDQERPLYRGFRVEELLALGKKMNPKWDDQFARTIIADSGIPIDKRIKRLSIGQRAQVALVLCMAKRPELLMLDEPVAALDPLARRHLMERLMETVVQQETTVFLASHVISELEDVCDYIVIMSNSHIQVADDIDHLLSNHQLLVGPRTTEDLLTGLGTVVRARHSKRQTTLLLRGPENPQPEGWQVLEPSLEEVVLAYLEEQEGESRPNPKSSDGSSLQSAEEVK